LVGFFKGTGFFDVESSVVGLLVLDGPDLESSSSQPLLVVNMEGLIVQFSSGWKLVAA
jgi:hypothetical protein